MTATNEMVATMFGKHEQAVKDATAGWVKAMETYDKAQAEHEGARLACQAVSKETSVAAKKLEADIAAHPQKIVMDTADMRLKIARRILANADSAVSVRQSWSGYARAEAYATK